jgi:hypothetical protein
MIAKTRLNNTYYLNLIVMKGNGTLDEATIQILHSYSKISDVKES